ncbi:Odr-4 protein [Globisporangium polare]
MSRSRKPAVDAALSAHWQRAVTERRAFEIGLIIGQTSAAGVADALLTGIPVPSESEDEEARSFDDVSIDWVQEYAKQIDRLLPGGVSVVGLYVVSAAPARAVLDHATFYLRAAVEALRVPKAFTLANDVGKSVHYAVHVCPNSNKTSARSVFELLDAAKSDAIPAELKSVASSSDALLALKRFTTTVVIDEGIGFAPTKERTAASGEVAEKVLDAVQQQLLPLVQRVQSAMGIVRNRRAAATGNSEPISVQLVSALPPATMASAHDQSKTHRAGSFRGAISCVAYVLASEPNAQEAAVAYLKQDFVKSLLLRVELVREKYTDEDASAALTTGPFGAHNGGGKVAFPKRATLPWSSAMGLCPHFPALLHVFQEEEEGGETAVQNALEILGSASDDSSSRDSSASFAFLESDSQQQQNKNKNKRTTKAASAATTSAATATAPPITSNSSLIMALAVLLVFFAIVAQQLL